MSNFRLDKIKLSKVAGVDEFRVSGIFNINGNGNYQTVIGNYEPLEKEMIINLDHVAPGSKVEFNYPIIDFGAYGRKEWLTFLLNEKVNVGTEENPVVISRLSEVAGITIKDTDYPPPYVSKPVEFVDESDRQKEFSQKFFIEWIEFEREPEPNSTLFRVKFQLSYQDEQCYIITNLSVKTDLVQDDVNVLFIEMAAPVICPEQDPTQLYRIINYPEVGQNPILLNLSSFGKRGLPLILNDYSLVTPSQWAIIALKKMLFFVN